MADYLLKVLHRDQTETHSIFLKRRPICLFRNIDLRGRLLVWNTPRDLQRCSQRTETGELHFVCSLCLTPTCQYLPGKSLYPYLIPQFLQPEDTSVTLGSGGRRAYTHRSHRTITQKEILNSYHPQGTAVITTP